MALERKGALHGKINNLVYREVGEQQIVQIAPGKVKQTKPTKLAALEFGLASTQAKALRLVFKLVYEELDGRLSTRLNSTILQCMRQSKETDRGKRTLHNGNLAPLKGLQFNSKAPIEKCVLALPEYTRQNNGTMHLKLSFNPANDIRYPSGDSIPNICFNVTILAFHFLEEKTYVIDSQNFLFKNLNNTNELRWNSSHQLPDGYIIITCLSLRYLQQNWLNELTQIHDTAFFPAIIIDAFHATAEMAEQGRRDGLSTSYTRKDPLISETKGILQQIQDFEAKNS